MRYTKKRFKQIVEKYKPIFDALENYDKTHKLPFQRKRIDITLSNRAIDKLKEMSKGAGKSMSRIIEEKLLG